MLQTIAHGEENTLFFTYVYSEIAVLLAFASFGYFLGSYADRLEHLTTINKLTKLYNRNFIMDLTPRTIEYAKKV